MRICGFLVIFTVLFGAIIEIFNVVATFLYFLLKKIINFIKKRYMKPNFKIPKVKSSIALKFE